MITKEEFEGLSPFRRGYAVYMCGCRDDQPNVPDEKNPYPVGTHESLEWSRGMTRAVLEVQDLDG